ncbi:FUSC family protein [Nocardioides mesophilus]|uniref:FUSC family protein n=1 Tax=Nocardioides mesophilus TaxID=433659 RepID=A0A7G9RF20_9ACTN|nr:FUSC family protein [Nocardioides mesophilus]QNN54195.1 FUSC family protein [Nocardioides mesophilus]
MDVTTTPLDRALERGRSSARQRLARLRQNTWHIVQCALAAAAAYFVASEVLGHATPFFAPIAAVVSLGTSYGQRLRRVAEVTLGVAIGVFVADLFVTVAGSGAWQLALVVAIAMSTAFLLDASRLFVTQAAVQSIVVTTLVPDPGAGFTRWTDALVGGAVALVAATMVPRAPLRRPREQAAVVVRKTAQLLRSASEVMVDGDVERALVLLADARSTESLVRELQDAADEGLSVVASSPFRVRHREPLRRMAELVEPLDLALRNTRVLVRRAAVAAHRQEPVPPGYVVVCAELADAADAVATELEADRMPIAAQPALLAVAAGTGRLERSPDLSAESILAQMRSVVADLLRITGMGVLESSDALPPAPH